ncbi:SDR family NAD(P)-dependent oxidoreductase [Microbacterium sp. NPDC089696]|uniref:SDR family NAD(P)-dependent oxidoreductase n=1 Tax=Microbacterium sp. NPDC089696 TaxID=3364199 RepID=UPI0038201A74
MSERAPQALTEKIAIITGGGKGIGRGIVDRFLAAGARVAIAQRSPLDDHLAAHDDVLAIAADLADPDVLPEVVARTVERFGGLDVVVNNAGIMFERDLDDLTLDDWQRMMALNVTTPVFLAKAALPHLRARGGGAIVNIGSTEGLFSNPGHIAYSASKGAIHGLTRAMAVDLGADGIRINAIAPGWISSDLSDTYLESFGDVETANARLLNLHPAGRIGRPTDVGDLAVFLAGDGAGFLTGETIVLDGGRTVKLSSPA